MLRNQPPLYAPVSENWPGLFYGHKEKGAL
jgi:hypothetical protein